ncbi:MAG: zinc ribbon domain-containing protein [Clostridiales bacterium]|nr:zinc ribbon domain-containing protein [Clostridiales bacterium]
MKKNKSLIIFVIIALFFLAPALAMVGSLKQHFTYKNILQNGQEAIATIIDGSMTSTITVNKVEYYSIGYIFYDEQGNQHSGRTSENYNYYDIKQIENNGVITIKYMSNTFESVEANYSLGPALKVPIILCAVFFVVDLLLWGVVISNIVKIIKAKGIYKNGTEYTATFVSISSNLTVNGTPMYKVAYFWRDDNGQIIDGISGHDYTFYEANAFEQAGSFKIKAIGEQSVIVTKPSKLLANNNTQIVSENSYYRCEYCNTLYNKDKTKCPSCGAGNVKK